MIEVARRSPVPIATGESFSSKQQFAELLEDGLVNILQPEPLNLGGLFATRKICDMIDAHLRHDGAAQRAGPGLLGGLRAVERVDCRTSSSTKSSMSSTNRGRRRSSPTRSRWWTATSRFRRAPGIGIDLNIEEIAKHPYSQENVIPLFKKGWEKREGR